MGRGDRDSQTQIRPASVRTPDEKTRERIRRRDAARAVATRALDAEDCALLLDMLGLHPNEGLTP